MNKVNAAGEVGQPHTIKKNRIGILYYRRYNTIPIRYKKSEKLSIEVNILYKKKKKNPQQQQSYN